MRDVVGAALDAAPSYQSDTVVPFRGLDFNPSTPLDEDNDNIADSVWGDPEGAPTSEIPAKLVNATPFVVRDPALIPPRAWIYGTHLIGGYVSMTAAPGAAGKSTLLVTMALALASGRPLLGSIVHGGPRKVWLWNLEDPRDELERRIVAAMAHHNLKPEDIGNRLYLDSGRDQGLCIAKVVRSDFSLEEPVVDALVAEMKHRQIDVLIVDPFVSSHLVPENDNGAMDRVSKEWGKVAHKTGAAIELVHHTKKLGGFEATSESLRGAVALVAAARSVLVINKMTKKEAEEAQLESPHGYIKVFDDKNNLAPPAEHSDWFHLTGVKLANGDHVGVIERWHWPDALAEVTAPDLYAVQKAIDAGNYRVSPQSPDWAGHAVAKALGLDLDQPADRKDVTSMMKTWVKNGALIVLPGEDKNRKTRPYVRVGNWAQAPASTRCATPEDEVEQ